LKAESHIEGGESSEKPKKDTTFVVGYNILYI